MLASFDLESSEHNWANVSGKAKFWQVGFLDVRCSFRISWQIPLFHKFSFLWRHHLLRNLFRSWPAWVARARYHPRLSYLGCKYVCMYVYHRICLDFNYGPRNRGSFVRSQLIQNYTPKGKVNTVSSKIVDCRLSGLWKTKSGEILFRAESQGFASKENECKWRWKK